MTTGHGLLFCLCLFCSTVFVSLFVVCELWLVSNKVSLLVYCNLEFSHYIAINFTVLNGENIYP